MNKTKIILTFLVSVVLSYGVFSLLYVKTQGLGGLKLHHSPDEIKQKAAVFAREMELNTRNTYIKTDISSNGELISFIQNKYGVEEGNQYIRDSVPGFFWNIRWQLKGVSGVRINAGDDKDKKVEDYLKELTLKYDSKGHLVKFEREVEDSVSLPKVSHDEARMLAESFLMKYSGIANPMLMDTSIEKMQKQQLEISYGISSSGMYELKTDRKIDMQNRTDYEFIWTGDTGLKGLKKKIIISIAGNLISTFRMGYEVEPGYIISDDSDTISTISKIGFFVIIFILLAVIAYKRIRAFEIGFRMAFIMGIVVAIASGIEINMEINSEFTWELLIPLILGPLFIGGGVVLVWAASETITREVWKEKFISIDLATKGYVLHSRVGSALLKGISGGVLFASAGLIILLLLEKFFGVRSILEDNNSLKHFNTMSPGFSIIIRNLYACIFLVGVFFIFIVSGLKRRFPSLLLLITLCALMWGIVNAGGLQPYAWGILFEALLGAAFVYLFIKTDVLVTLISLVTYYVVSSGFVLVTIDNPYYTQSSVFLLVVMIFAAGIAIVSLYTKDKITEYDTITPAFAKNITERQRLQRELEIARDVQMSFLPKQTPTFPGLEVASRCIPALEVGGDYYDFVQLNNNKFGIIIGDVSGKGTQAAFYMTLTKGFLKAVSRLSDSPSVVLSQMNELFYENVERGTFISMIYGIFDSEKKLFKLSRAGHNPVILKNSPDKIEMLNPTGLALGLEKGVVFSRTIKEIEIPYAPGDIFIFYTDGFTEAMNKQKEEYGEQRLAALVENSANMSADEILQHIIKDVRSFMGKADQHDDMTMVVVKVTAD